jgi:general secretion pathway protein C
MRDSIASVARAAPALATLLLLVLGGFLAARWVTYFAAPSEAASPPARERPQLGPAAQTLAGAHLFGVASSGETVSNLNVKLRGVFAGGGTGTGFAIVNAGGRDQATRIGGEIVPGVTLESVHAGHVVLRRAGALERVNLEERVSAQAAGAPPPRYAQAAPPPPRPAPAPAASGAAPSQSSNPGARFKRPEPYAPVGDVPTDSPPPAPGSAPAAPESAPRAPVPRPLSAGAAPGLLIQDVPAGSMLERIGLQPGDVVRSVNGEAVASEADVARVLQQRGMQGSFTAEVQRGGMTVPIAVSGVR